jgi:hypothetical protein
MSTTILFGYAGLSISWDPAADPDLHAVLARAREARATLDAAAASPAPPAELSRPTGAGTRPGRNAPPPATVGEAERRFYARYGDAIGGETWACAQRALGRLVRPPETVEEWIRVAEEIRDRQRPAA